MKHNAVKKWFQKNIVSAEKPHLMQYVLMPVSWAYGMGVLANQGLYALGICARGRLPKPVISVGNITCGGTGKTPFVLRCYEALQARGKRCGVLIRGYGQDEVRLLEAYVRDGAVIAGRNRYQEGMAFLAKNGAVDVFLMDDGFQHHALNRDCNIVLINAMNPFGQGMQLLPAGMLREPLRGLKRAHLIAVTHADEIADEQRAYLRETLGHIAPSVPVITCKHRAKQVYVSASDMYKGVDSLVGRQVIAFCGIGYGAGFKKTLEECGARICAFVAYGDHESYGDAHVQELQRLQKKYPAAVCVTTEKDYMRDTVLLRDQLQVLVVTISIEILEGEDIFDNVMDSVFSD